jgi:hypothetical protein
MSIKVKVLGDTAKMLEDLLLMLKSNSNDVCKGETQDYRYCLSRDWRDALALEVEKKIPVYKAPPIEIIYRPMSDEQSEERVKKHLPYPVNFVYMFVPDKSTDNVARNWTMSYQDHKVLDELGYHLAEITAVLKALQQPKS